MNITIHKVAEEAGVSTAAVSIALSSKQGKNRRLAGKTIEHIRNVARSMGYRPNLLASNLRLSKTNTIGVLIAALHGDFYEKILAGINKKFSGSYTPMLGVHNYDSNNECRQLEVLLGSRVDGVIATFSGNPESIALYYELSSRYKIPLVLVDRNIPGVDLPVVRSDHYGQTYEAAKALIKLGHKHILYFTAAIAQLESTELRKQGYFDAMKESNLENELKIIAKSGIRDLKLYAREIIDFWQNSPARATAILVQNDWLGYELLTECKLRKIQVPEELSIMGLDDCYLSSLEEIGLSSVAQNPEMIGYKAAELLNNLIEGKTWDGKVVILPTEVVMRKTTKAFD